MFLKSPLVTVQIEVLPQWDDLLFKWHRWSQSLNGLSEGAVTVCVCEDAPIVSLRVLSHRSNVPISSQV